MSVINLTILMLGRLIYTATEVNYENPFVKKTHDRCILFSKIFQAFKDEYEVDIQHYFEDCTDFDEFHKNIYLLFKKKRYVYINDNHYYPNMVEFTLLDSRKQSLICKITISSYGISFILKRETNWLFKRFNEVKRVESLKENLNVVKFLYWRYGYYANLLFFKQNYNCNYRVSWIIMEYLYFNFKHYLQFHINKKEQINENVLIKMLKDILNALVECHSKGIIHGDLKTENIMGKKYITPEDHIHFVLIDFGLSVKLDNGDEETHDLEFNVGTSYYKAPEVMESNPKLTTKSDIWSLGIILFLIKSEEYDVSKMIIKTEFHSQNSILEEIQYLSCSEEMKDFISKCLKINFRERLTAEELREHHLFTTPKVNNVDLGK